MSSEIILSRGKVAIIDDEDFPLLSQFKWYANFKKGKGMWYAQRQLSCREDPRRPHVAMHRVIMNAPRCLQVDHINHNGLDNRRANLRTCSNSQNQYNQRPQKGRSSLFKGVHWHSRDKVWVATITVDGLRIHLGNFTSEQEAAFAYDHAAQQHFGHFAYLNLALNG